MKKILFTALAVLCILFFSCASTEVPETPRVPLTNSKRVHLLSPSFIEDPFEDVFLLLGEFGNSSLVAPFFVKSDSEGIFIQMLGDFGVDLATIRYNGEKVSFESSILPSSFIAEMIISDFQLAYYKIEALSESLGKVSLEITQKERGDIIRRKVVSGKKLVASFEINKKTHEINVSNFIRGYSYSIVRASDE